MRSPTGVIVISVLPRSNSGAPSSSSSFWIATDSAGWLTKHFAAARPKLRSRATATMYRSSLSVRLWSPHACGCAAHRRLFR
jgi:hypothetical protein